MENSPSKEVLEKTIGYALSMEYLGIHVEDSGENKLEGSTWTKVTVPESSELDLQEDFVKEVIGDMPYKTSDNLIEIAKYIIRRKLLTAGFGEDESQWFDDEEDMKDFFKYTDEKVKIYAKVREGDVWNIDKANEAINKLLEQIKEGSGYKEV